MKTGFLVGIIIVLLTVIFIGANLLLRKTPTKIAVEETAMPTPLPSLTQTPTQIASPTVSTQKGTIEGSLSYPSEKLPENMEICAESVSEQQTICTKEKIKDKKYTYGVGYKLAVPAGKYFVFAKILEKDYSAYYDEFVTCGLLASCTSHKPIEIEVKVNQTTSKIDPQDWYNIQPSL